MRLLNFLVITISYFQVINSFTLFKHEFHKRGKVEYTAACASAIALGNGIYKACNSKSPADIVDATVNAIGVCTACGTAYALWRAKISKKKTLEDVEKALMEGKNAVIKANKDQKKITDYFKTA